jgi:hypothetical protein
MYLSQTSVELNEQQYGEPQGVDGKSKWARSTVLDCYRTQRDKLNAQDTATARIAAVRSQPSFSEGMQ